MRAGHVLLAVLVAWATRAQAQAPPLVPQRLAVAPAPDPPFGPNATVAGAPDGRLCLAWLEDPSSSTPGLQLRCSANGGIDWEPQRWVADGLPYSLAVSPGGVVDVLIWATGGEIQHRRSLDGGRSFGPARQVIGYSGYVQFAASPAGALLVTYHDAGTTWARVSRDGGATWATPAALPAPHVNAVPLWLDESTIVVVYGANSSEPRFGAARSVDGGQSFGPFSQIGQDESVSLPTQLARTVDGEVLLVTNGGGVYRSSGGGATWSALGRFATSPNGWAAVARDPDGTFVADLARDVNWEIGGTHRLYRSNDGSAWTALAVPGGLADCSPVRPEVTALGRGVFRVGSLLGWRTDDLGQTWQAERAPKAYQPPYDGARLLGRADGRMVELWLSGSDGPMRIESRVSDDQGLTWSAPRQVSDNDAWGYYWPGSTFPNVWRAITTRDGSFVVVWMAASGDGCGEYRVARSDDGINWQPGVAVLGSRWPRQGPSLVETAAGELVLLMWPEPWNAVLSRSLDGGRSWSPVEQPVLPMGFQDPGNLLATADGALLLPGQWCPLPACELVVLRSFDRFQSWEMVWLDGYFQYFAADILRAGPVLHLNFWNTWTPGSPARAFESRDEGRTWLRLTDGYAWGTFAGAADGSLYLPEDSGGGPHLIRRTPAGERIDLGRLPDTSTAAALAFDAATIDAASIGLAYTENLKADPPGAFFLRAPGAATAGILRDDRIRSLEPRPDLSLSFPLPPYPTGLLAPGMADPDAAVLADASRPLVFYGLGFATGEPLRLTRSPAGRVRLHW